MRFWVTQINKYIIIFIILIPSLLYANQDTIPSITVNHYTIENGLNHNRVFKVFKDARNTIWALTRNGISQFDGKSFQSVSDHLNFKHSPFRDAVVDGDGNIWFLRNFGFHSFLGAEILNPLTREFINIEKEEGYPISLDEIAFLSPISDGSILFYTKQHQLIKFFKQNDYEVIDLEGSFQEALVLTLHADQSGNYYLVSWSNDEIHDVRTYTTDGKYLPRTKKIEKNSKEFKKINVLNKYLFKKEELEKITKPNFENSTNPLNPALNINGFPWGKIRSFFDSKRNLYWYIQNSVVTAIHPLEGLRYQYPFNFLHAQSIINDILVEDHTIWISTGHNGILQLTFEKNHFKTIINRQVRGARRITKDAKHQLWVASDNRISVYDSSYQSIYKSTYPSSVVYKGQQDKIYVLRIKDKEVITYDSDFNLIANYMCSDTSGRTWDIVEDSLGIVWFIDEEGISYIEPNKEIRNFENTKELASQLKNVYEIVVESENQFWICSTNGLYLFNTKNGHYEKFGNTEEGNHFLPAIEFNDIYKDKDGVYWIVTQNNGLIKWQKGDDQKKTYDHFSSHNGMPSKIMHGIYEDENGFLWISSENGLIQFHKESSNFRVFTEKDGIANNEFNRISHYKDEDGIIYFGGVKGVTFFNPDDFKVENSPISISLLSIENIQAGQKKNYLPEYYKEGNINFKNSSDRFLIKFGSEKNTNYNFSYSLDDSKSWIALKEHEFLISNLPYGNHQLFIQEENINGTQTGLLKINISVPTPFYLSKWFLLALALLIMAIGVLIYKAKEQYYLNKQKELEHLINEKTQDIKDSKKVIEKQHSELQYLNESKAQFFKFIAHELKNPLTLILGATKILEKTITTDNKKEVEKLHYIKSIENNSQNILDLSNEVSLLGKLDAQVEKLNNSPIKFYLLMQRIIGAYNETVDLNNKYLEFNYELDKELYLSLDVSKFEKVVSNLISNAFKYTPHQSTISVSVRTSASQKIQVEVSDTGYGIRPEDLPFIFKPYYRSNEAYQKENSLDITNGTNSLGIGLSIAKKMATLLGGDLWIAQTGENGSTFIFEMPRTVINASNLEKNLIKEKINVPRAENDSLNNQPQSNIIRSHILIVEDHVELSKFLQKLLEPQYKLSVAANGIEALKVLKENTKNKRTPVTLVISDIMMPVLDGVNFLKEIKKHKIWKNLPFIFLTGYSNEPTRSNAIQLGVDDYILKPFEPEELITIVKNLISNYQEKTFALENEKNSIQILDKEWFDKLNDVIYKNLGNRDFNIIFLSKELYISKRQLTRRIKLYTGLTPGKYVQELRLQEARKLLETKTYRTVSEICFSIGFASPSYFSKQYKLRFGKTPSSYFSEQL